MEYLLARAANGRPTLMHRINPSWPYTTMCGLNFTYWSRAYMKSPITQILCKKCGRY